MARESDSTQDPSKAAAIAGARLTCLLALRDYDGFVSRFDELTDRMELVPNLPALKAIRERLRNPEASERPGAKIFGIGLSKTGTTSLTAALERLGIAAIQFKNPLTRELITDDDFPFFDAFTDTPVGYQFERLHGMFPHAKSIYTRRPIQAWIQSLEKHFQRNWSATDFDKFKVIHFEQKKIRWGEQFRAIHINLYCRHASVEEAYRYHDERVKSFFAGPRRDQLLEFDMFSGDGWPELCNFLAKPVPTDPFPWQNKTIDIP